VRVRNLVPEKRWKSHFREYFEEQFNNKKLSKAAEAVSFKSLIDEFGLRDRDAVEKAYEQPSVLKLRGLLADKGLKLEDVIESGVKAFWKIRFEEINDYERSRARNGMQILKFYLHIDKEEQLKRIWDRVNKPEKNWKVSEADFTERKLWKAYRKAYEEMLSATSTKHAPWFILPANHKWFSRLAASEIVAGHFESLGMKYPEPTVDIEQIKREYFGIKAPGDKPRFDLA